MFYIFSEGKPERVHGDSVSEIVDTWAEWFCHTNRSIHYTNMGGASVSTVFIGIDYNFFEHLRDEPLVFESMVFNGLMDGIVRRAATVQEALGNHAQLVNQAYIATVDDVSFFPLP